MNRVQIYSTSTPKVEIRDYTWVEYLWHCYYQCVCENQRETGEKFKWLAENSTQFETDEASEELKMSEKEFNEHFAKKLNMTYMQALCNMAKRRTYTTYVILPDEKYVEYRLKFG